MKELLPSAVTEVGDVTCCDGEKIDNFLMVDKVSSHFGFTTPPCCVRVCLTPPPAGADFHGERWGSAAAVKAHRQPGDSDQRAGGVEPAAGQAEEPDGKPALDGVRFTSLSFAFTDGLGLGLEG